MKATRQRVAVREALDRAGAFRTAQALHDEMKTAGEAVGLTTVYRTLQALADAGEVDVLRTADGEAIYRRCATGDHHHHLVCRSCGASVEVSSDEVERWAAATAELHGFSDVEHTAELYGTCRGCS
ncbi:MAG TPA: Fur family transcriptional regulator [Actinomycetota bacterium]|nr:Fur family transcriptional regulator [Actinomycetota bacterium]